MQIKGIVFHKTLIKQTLFSTSKPLACAVFVQHKTLNLSCFKPMRATFCFM